MWWATGNILPKKAHRPTLPRVLNLNLSAPAASSPAPSRPPVSEAIGPQSSAELRASQGELDFHLEDCIGCERFGGPLLLAEQPEGCCGGFKEGGGSLP